MNNIFSKFPPERKDEFLNWVMITRGQDEWCTFVFEYTNNHQLKNWYDGFQFVIKWARECPSTIAFHMVKDGHAKPEWAMRGIENAKIGNPSRAAYLMVKYGHAKPEWAMRVIENDTIGNPSWAAQRMVEKGFAEPEWAMKIIENDKIGSPSRYAYYMVRGGYVPQEWYDENFKHEQ